MLIGLYKYMQRHTSGIHTVSLRIHSVPNCVDAEGSNDGTVRKLVRGMHVYIYIHIDLDNYL